MASSLLRLSKQDQKEFLTRSISRWMQQRSFSELDFDQIANELNMSPRSLRRHLQSHELCYKDLVKSERKRHAVSLISQQKQTLESIGKQLGYHDASSFSRAFKEWYGISPTHYQKQNQEQVFEEIVPIETLGEDL